MEKLEDCILGFKKMLIGTRKVKLSEYFARHDINFEDLSNLSKIDFARLNLKFSMEQVKFTNYVIRNNYWVNDSRVNLIYSENGKVIQTNPGRRKQHELIENQRDSPYMRTCPKEWLDNCLAYNAGIKLSELRKISNLESD